MKQKSTTEEMRKKNNYMDFTHNHSKSVGCCKRGSWREVHSNISLLKISNSRTYYLEELEKRTNKA